MSAVLGTAAESGASAETGLAGAAVEYLGPLGGAGWSIGGDGVMMNVAMNREHDVAMEQHEPESITIMNICNGGVPEVFERELREVLANIADPNTAAEKIRGLTLKFVFVPHEDRSGAHVAFSCKATLQPVKIAKSQVFLSRHTGALKAYAADHRQVAMFGPNDASPVKVVK